MNLKPQTLQKQGLNRIIAFVVFAVTLAVYVSTQANSLSFWDAGEYVTCSSILGIPHPPGNPFYILLGRFLTAIIPGAQHAWIVAFASGLASALAVMFTYLFSVKLFKMFVQDDRLAFLGGAIAALFTAFSYTFWMNAVEAEVYAGLALTINSIVWLTLLWAEKSKDFSHQHLLLLIIYIFFLGFGIHQTSLQIAPAVLFVVIYPLLKDHLHTTGLWVRAAAYGILLFVVYLIFTRVVVTDIPIEKYMLILIPALLIAWHLRQKVGWQVWAFAIGLVLVGLSTHLFLPIRSAHRPFINEGHPSTWKLFWEYVMRLQYGETSFMIRRASFWYQLKDQFLTYFSWQFFDAPTLSSWLKINADVLRRLALFITGFLGITGAFWQFRRNRASFYYWAAFFFMSSLAMVFVINLSDAEVRERDYFFVTAYNFWAVWMAAGLLGLISFCAQYAKPLKGLAIAVAIALPIFNLATQYHIHDRSQELIAIDYGLNLINGLEENAIIFTNGDNDTFPVWYLQAVKDRYAVQKEIPPARGVYPNKDDIAAMQSAIDFKASTLAGIRPDVTIANLSLLNTPWYIRQLRDKEGVQFNFLSASDAQKVATMELPQLNKQSLYVFDDTHTAYLHKQLADASITKQKYQNLYKQIDDFYTYTSQAGRLRLNSTPQNQRKNLQAQVDDATNKFNKFVAGLDANLKQQLTVSMRAALALALNDDMINHVDPELVASTSFSDTDINNWNSFLYQLNGPGESIGYIKDLLSDSTKQLVSNFALGQTPVDQVKQAVLSDLNSALNRQLPKLEQFFFTNANLLNQARQADHDFMRNMNYQMDKAYSTRRSRELRMYNNVLISRTLPKVFNTVKTYKYTMDYVKDGQTLTDSLTASFPVGHLLLHKDIASIQLIRNNYRHRPIYFAVTVADNVGFDNCLVNEGMVDRLTSGGSRNAINTAKLTYNLDNVYLYRGIDSDAVYKDGNMNRLLSNYGSSFLRAYYALADSNRADEGLKYLERARPMMEDKKRLLPLIADAYLKTNQPQKAVDTIMGELAKDSTNVALLIQGGLLLGELNRPDECFALLENALNYAPQSEDALSAIYSASYHYNQFDRGIDLLTRLLNTNPNNQRAGMYLQEMKRAAQEKHKEK